METTPPTFETIAETMETVAETVAEAIAETIPAATDVIEVVETIDYTPMLNEILAKLQSMESAALLLSSFALFAVVVCLCYFCYKFFRIFF